MTNPCACEGVSGYRTQPRYLRVSFSGMSVSASRSFCAMCRIEAKFGAFLIQRRLNPYGPKTRSGRSTPVLASERADLDNDQMASFDPFRFVLICVAGWMNQRQLQMIEYLREENRVLREQL